ncbi:fatty-acid peroxygenase [Catalinimonas alkaloidigena]|uniref:cytochrome P450 n=1 Tax=Catalinimonas alkaloidigena TaxID=1075417 RepID=UPI00240713DE|nr:cytochrome P450 [Catalinimonas alkaloidigena]MDF9797084.1 fatty-acid peroxygenase [Catalinimonas alkaloidigena]
MTPIPNDPKLDSTIALLADGYTFISKRCQRYQSDVFQTRLLFQKTICMRGKEAAKVFYDTELFKRKNAAPKRFNKTLFGQGGVQALDGQPHAHRKQMFMSLMTHEGLEELVNLTAKQWENYIKKWEQQDQIVLFEEVEEILFRAVCSWAGVPLQEPEVKQRTKEMAAMIKGSGAVGLEHWQSRLSRKRAEQWIENMVEKVREHKMEAKEGAALQVFSQHRTPEGELLDKKIVAVEVLNVLRPTVAIGRFIVFAALALYQYPQYRQKLAEEDGFVKLFVQEVRRFYPFFPFAAARVKSEFSWKGFRFPSGQRVLLDLYGTNHDPRLWEKPEEFKPDRFRHRDENPFDFIPQGGGDFYTNHRCAGEWVTIELMKVALRNLVSAMSYQVPDQDLRISLSDLPALPKSRFIIKDVKRI